MSRPSELLFLTLLNSIWQGGLLYLFAHLLQPILNRFTPVSRRNFLLSLVALQIFLSVLTALSVSGMSVPGNFFAYSFNIQNPILQQITDLLMITYIIFSGYRILRISLSFSSLPYRYGRKLQKAPHELRLFTAIQAAQWGIKRKVSIYLSDYISTPLTYGILKPVILIPASLMTGLKSYQLEAIILHELAHIRNLDYLANFLLLLTESIYFFNPFITGLASRIRLEQEKECDLQVLNHKQDPLDYAETLLSLATLPFNKTEPAPQFAKNDRQLLNRILFITQFSQSRFSKRTRLLTLLFIGFSGFMVWITPSSQRQGKIQEKQIAFRQTRPINYYSPKIYLPKQESQATEKKENRILKNTTAKKNPGEVKQAAPTESAPAVDMDMYPAPAYDFANLASSVEPPQTKQAVIREEISGGLVITLHYTLSGYADKWDYHLDSLRIEETQAPDRSHETSQ